MMKWLRRNVWRLLALAASVALALGFVPEAHSALSSLPRLRREIVPLSASLSPMTSI